MKQARVLDDDGAEVGLQYAALPWRRAPALEVMLITSRETRRWVIPKGWPIPGSTAAQSAAPGFASAGERKTASRTDAAKN